MTHCFEWPVGYRFASPPIETSQGGDSFNVRDRNSGRVPHSPLLDSISSCPFSELKAAYFQSYFQILPIQSIYGYETEKGHCDGRYDLHIRSISVREGV